MIDLNPSTFFGHYINDAWSQDLSTKNKIAALGLSILIGLCTVGIAQLVCYCLNKHNMSLVDLDKQIKRNFEKVSEKVNNLAIHLRKPQSAEEVKGFPQNNEDVSKEVQKFIDHHYSKPLPPKEDVEVPHKGKWVKWNTLSQHEKVEVNNHRTLPHNQLPHNCIGQLIVDAKFFTHRGQTVYLQNDPRHSHGSDHSARAAIFAGVFGYLYHKYHPDYSVTAEEIRLAQVVTGGHDSGRQTEGPDVYDEKSAEHTVKHLREMGIADPRLLDICHNAIADKDNKNLHTKSFIAKCTQNADCAEFARIYLKTHNQNIQDFNHSRGFLDIYNELHQISQGKPDSMLKNGLTYQNFITELDAVRTEMNRLIFETHQSAPREHFSQPGTNYYQALQAKITPETYPLLHQITKKYS